MLPCEAYGLQLTDLGQREGMAQVKHAIHVGVWEVSKELLLLVCIPCMWQLP